MTQRRCILHIVPHVSQASFGIGPIVLNLATSQQALGHTVEIWSFDTPPVARHIEMENSLRDHTIRSFSTLGPAKLGYSPTVENAIIADGLAFDLIHQHGIWTGISHAVNRWQVSTKRPTIVCPHGSLKPWALARSRWKKRLAMMLYEHRNLHNASCMHALSYQEAVSFQEFGLSNAVAVIPNGISAAWIDRYGEPERFRARHALEHDLRLLLFLGRITPIKGLPMLLRAMDLCREQMPGWKLVIAGVDEFNHQAEVQSLVRELALQPYVQFVGPQFDQDKRDAFAAADVFVLPSYSEGAPVVILEALGAGIPTLTTEGTPWEDLVTHRCGWWTGISVEAIADALLDVLKQPREALKEMGQRGMTLVRQKYTWPKIADQTITLYNWLLNGGAQPAFVLK